MLQKEGEGSSCGKRSWTMFVTLIFPSAPSALETAAVSELA